MKEEEAIQKGINVEALKQEQKKLSKLVKLDDSSDFSLAQRFAGIVCETTEKDLIAVVVVLDEKGEIVDKRFTMQKPRFPYIPGFRAYRELPSMIEAYKKLEEEPDVIFILGQGISHPQGLGIASHLGISLNKPVIAIAKNIICGKEKGENILLDGKIISKKIITKEKSNPLYVSQGNMISLKTAVEITKKSINSPHKFPEPLVQARKFLKEVREEMVVKT